MTDVLIKKKKRNSGHRHPGRRPCVHGGRDWGDASTSLATPKIASEPSAMRGETWNRRPLQTQKEPTLRTLDLGLPTFRSVRQPSAVPAALGYLVTAALANSYTRLGQGLYT